MVPWGSLCPCGAWLFLWESASIPFKSSATPSTCTGVMWRYSGIRFRLPYMLPSFPSSSPVPSSGTRDVAQELQERKHSTAMAYEGACRFLVGLGKKVILANNLGLLCQSYRSSADPTVLFAWLSALGFFLQIYYDFSGYSDMAIGLGRILGFHFPENFRYPYCSRSVTEFWRRWHMTLGAWFRDYVYIPLGGNRTGKLRWMGNILLVWCLTGLWHGAGWNFLLWGLFYAILLLGEKLWYGPFLAKRPWFSHIYLLLSVLLGFVLFQGGSLEQSWGDFRAMLGAGSIPTVSQGKSVCPAESWRPSDSGRFGGYTLAWAAVPAVVKGSAMDRTPPSGAFAAALHSLSGRRFL